MAKLTAEIQLLLGNTAEFTRQVAAALNRTAYEAGRSMGPQFGGGLAASKTSQQMALSGNYAPGGAMGQPWQYTGPIPPKIRSGQSGTNMGLAGVGMAAGMFSPWIGARLINQSGIFNNMGGGGGGIGGALFGKGGYGGFGVAYLGLQFASRALKMAFDELREAITRTAKLFQESMAINRPIGNIFKVQSAFKSIGLSDDAAKRYAKSGPAGLTSEEMMQLTNMSGSFKRNMDEAKLDARAVAASAQAAQSAFESMTNMTREFKGVFNNPAFMAVIAAQLKISEVMLKALKYGNLLGITGLLLGKSDAGGGLAGGKGMFNWNQFRTTSMERMGFTIGGGNSVGSKIDTTNRILRTIANAMGAGIGGGNFGGAGPASNLP